MVAFALRDEVMRRRHSTGGRPALDGTDIRQRVPMRSAKCQRLEQLAKEFETETFHPTATQIAALFLEFAIDPTRPKSVKLGRGDLPSRKDFILCGTTQSILSIILNRAAIVRIKSYSIDDFGLAFPLGNGASIQGIFHLVIEGLLGSFWLIIRENAVHNYVHQVIV
jgi:hypothetical protein